MCRSTAACRRPSTHASGPAAPMARWRPRCSSSMSGCSTPTAAPWRGERSIHPFRPFDGLVVEGNDDLLVVAAHDHEIHGLARVRVQLLMRHIRGEVDEVSRPDVGREFHPLPPADLAATLHDLDSDSVTAPET